MLVGYKGREDKGGNTQSFRDPGSFHHVAPASFRVFLLKLWSTDLWILLPVQQNIYELREFMNLKKCLFLFIWKIVGERGGGEKKERDHLLSSQLPTTAGFSQGEFRSQEINPSLLYTWQGLRCSGHQYCFPSCTSIGSWTGNRGRTRI